MEEVKKETVTETETENTQTAQAENEFVSDGAVDNPVNKLEVALRESEDRYARILAEYDNFRKRSKKEQEAVYGNAFAQGVAAFLPVIDNLGRAVETECTDEQYKNGILLIDKQLKEIYGKLGIVEFGEKGETFDPEIHNAVMHVDDDELPENSVAEVFQKGYKIGDRIIRIAMVKVAN
ncbi:MAG: nucleotide exchange factor GrpE [Clostridia bacterium]|nr:nucleotide exchange factor GrpE [Clostridia bacterium]